MLSLPKLSLPNPWVILAFIAALAASAAGGAKLGMDHIIAKQTKTEELIAAVREQAQQGAAEAIGKIDIKQTVINRKVETITREVPVYRECLNTPDVSRLLDDARANRDTAVSPGGSVVSNTGSSKSQ